MIFVSGYSLLPLPPASLLRIAEYVAVGDEKVGPAVVVHVEEAGAEANVLLTDSRDPGNPGAEQKESSALVAIEAMHFMLVVADPKRSPAAAVVIATVHAHAAVGHAAIIAGHTYSIYVVGAPATPQGVVAKDD